MNSGLYQELTDAGLIVRHDEVEIDPVGPSNAYKVLHPESIPFISYPYEWTFSQLKDAALIILQAQIKALNFGMTLKDASAYNVQFLRGQAVLIDTLSFEKYQEGEPWVSYRQFCQHFLAPLALMSYQHVGLGQLSRIYIDGIPLDLAHALLPTRTHLHPALQMHIHLHARLQKKSEDRSHMRHGRRGVFSLTAFKGLIDSLESAIKKLKWHPKGTEWADYKSEDSYSEVALNCKQEVVAEFLRQVQPKRVWDLGANTGSFSRIASDMGISTVSFDKDPSAVEKNYIHSKAQGETNLLPLLLDMTNPSPLIGWANAERMDLRRRGPADMLLALALIHHLAISENVPLGMIADFFSQLCEWAVVEFVPKSDERVTHLLATRKDIFPFYTLEHFELEFSAFFDIKSKRHINGSERTLYLMKKR
jgi:ribosomal protein L11 methylase PrmA